MSDHRPGSDETTLAESNAANNRRVCADSHSFLNPGFHRDPVSIAASRGQIIRQHRVWTKKHVVTDVHVLPDADAVLDGDVVTYSDPALDESMVADVAVSADNGVLQHMSKCPYPRTFANCICFDECRLVNDGSFFWFVHSLSRILVTKRHKKLKNQQTLSFFVPQTLRASSGYASTAALHYYVTNAHNNDENGYDGHPVKSHLSGVLL